MTACACAVAEWAGELVEEGGGFCGAASPGDSMDLSAYDGIALRVKGGGETFKLNIKTSDQARCHACAQHRRPAPPRGTVPLVASSACVCACSLWPGAC